LYGDGELRKVASKVGTVHGFVANIEKEISNADIVLHHHIFQFPNP